jgi:hypothetical protein
VRILTDYLRDQGFEGPREKANGLIEQLRHRNWILCDRGADTYGFVHRTFLEYFCAMEIVHRFEKARTLTFEQLRDEVFGLHWQDETWHEVLRLICGSIDPKFACNLVEFILSRKCQESLFIDQEHYRRWGENRFISRAFTNLYLSDGCLSEIIDNPSKLDLKDDLVSRYKFEIENRNHLLNFESSDEISKRIFQNSPTQETYFWLREQINLKQDWVVLKGLISIIVENWKEDPKTLPWLYEYANSDSSKIIGYLALEQIANNWIDDPKTLPWIKDRIQFSGNSSVRRAGIHSTIWITYCKY